MNNQLIPVFAGELSGVSAQLVDARLLHSFLNVVTRFNDWIKNRIEEYGFIDGQDYYSIFSNRSGGTAGKRRTDYHLSIDMAKELGMIERNDKGRQIRRYFIEMERQAQLSTNPLQLPSPPTISKAQIGELYTLVSNKARSIGRDTTYFWIRFNNYFHLNSYQQLPASRFEEALDFLYRLEGDDTDSFRMLSPKELATLVKRQMKAAKLEALMDKTPAPVPPKLTIPRDELESLVTAIVGEVLPRQETPQQCVTINLSPLVNRQSRRWLITQACDEMVIMHSLTADNEVLSREQFIQQLQDDGYLVIKKEDVLNKLSY